MHAPSRELMRGVTNFRHARHGLLTRRVERMNLRGLIWRSRMPSNPAFVIQLSLLSSFRFFCVARAAYL
jgi:hypothetical protein